MITVSNKRRSFRSSLTQTPHLYVMKPSRLSPSLIGREVSFHSRVLLTFIHPLIPHPNAEAWRSVWEYINDRLFTLFSASTQATPL
jgi:hypothetical protein